MCERIRQQIGVGVHHIGVAVHEDNQLGEVCAVIGLDAFEIGERAVVQKIVKVFDDVHPDRRQQQFMAQFAHHERSDAFVFVDFGGIKAVVFGVGGQVFLFFFAEICQRHFDFNAAGRIGDLLRLGIGGVGRSRFYKRGVGGGGIFLAAGRKQNDCQQAKAQSDDSFHNGILRIVHF